MKTGKILTSGLSLFVVAGIVHGLWTDRWRSSPALEQAVAKLEGVPATIGEWDGTPIEINERERIAAGRTL